MKSEVYQIRGCSGSQKWVSVGEFDTIKDARVVARRLNQENADRLGLSMQDYYERSGGDEGWHCAGKAGFDGFGIS